MNAIISAIEFALPEKILTNDQLSREFPDWSADKILAKTGIRERRLADDDQCASDLAVAAAQQLFASGVCSPLDIDYLLFCTETPDYILPATACVLQHRLGLSNRCAALDFNLGCSGYVYGLGLAKALVECGQAKKLLLLTADTLTKLLHPRDKSIRTLLGDAATATLITAEDSSSSSLGPFVYGTDGSGLKNLLMPSGGMRQPCVAEAPVIEDDSGNARTANDFFMNGAEIFTFALRVVPDTVHRLLSQSGLTLDDIDLFVFHQANQFMLEHLRKKLKLPTDKFVIDMADVGNTSSSTIPIALKRALQTGRITSGQRLMLVGFGVGYSWAGSLIRWR